MLPDLRPETNNMRRSDSRCGKILGRRARRAPFEEAAMQPPLQMSELQLLQAMMLQQDQMVVWPQLQMVRWPQLQTVSSPQALMARLSREWAFQTWSLWACSARA